MKKSIFESKTFWMAVIGILTDLVAENSGVHLPPYALTLFGVLIIAARWIASNVTINP